MKQLSRLLGRPPSTLEIAGLDADGYTADFELGAMSIEELAQVIRSSRATGPDRVGTEERTKASSSRASVVALLVAEYIAREEADVGAFRSQHLPRGCIEITELESWITRRLGPKDERDSLLLVEWPNADVLGVRRAPVAPGSVADQLRRLCLSLETFYGWQPAQASAFVVCDAVPVVAPIKVRTRQRYPLSVTSRVILDVDPATSPAEVGAAYRRARSNLLPDGRRFRGVEARSLQVVAFAIDHAGDGQREQVAKWNRQHPEWAYSTADAYARAVRETRAKLLYPFT